MALVTSVSSGLPAPPEGNQSRPGPRRARAVPPSREAAAERTRRYVAARRRATGLLAAATAVFVGVTAAGAHGTVLGYVQAAAEASMVGGAADWFAVTALFRQPLGLPIPHTAVIVERKEQFAVTLGEFFQANFLNADVLAERVRSLDIGPRLAAWLADRGNATKVANDAAELIGGGLVLLSDEDVQNMLSDQLRRAVDRIDPALLLAHSLRSEAGRNAATQLFDAGVANLDHYLAAHQTELRDQFEAESPAWVPHAVYRRVFDHLHARLRRRLAQIGTDPHDETRQAFEQWLAALPDRLDASPQLQERARLAVREVVTSAELRTWSSAIWQDAKTSLQAQAADPASELHRQLADALVTAGRRLGQDVQLQHRLTRGVESVARTVATQFHDELAGIVSSTVQRWDATETANQLELLLGRDLQYIRINGTVVGGVIGVVLHAVARALS